MVPIGSRENRRIMSIEKLKELWRTYKSVVLQNDSRGSEPIEIKIKGKADYIIDDMIHLSWGKNGLVFLYADVSIFCLEAAQREIETTLKNYYIDENNSVPIVNVTGMYAVLYRKSPHIKEGASYLVVVKTTFSNGTETISEKRYFESLQEAEKKIYKYNDYWHYPKKIRSKDGVITELENELTYTP